MPITLREDLKQPWLIAVFSDPYTTRHSQQVMDAIWAHRLSSPTLRLLTDARHCTPPSTDFVRHAISMWQGHVNRMRGAKIAILTETEAQYGMARMAEMTIEAKQLPFQLAAFREWVHAEQWLESGSSVSV